MPSPQKMKVDLEIEPRVKAEPTKPGWRTTEFWINLLLQGVGIYLLTKGHEELGAILMGLAGGAYSLSRGQTKKGAAQAQQAIADVLQQAFSEPPRAPEDEEHSNEPQTLEEALMAAKAAQERKETPTRKIRRRGPRSIS